MPVVEREKLFATIARRGFEKDFYKHDEVFDDIRQSPFSLKEAAEYYLSLSNEEREEDRNWSEIAANSAHHLWEE